MKYLHCLAFGYKAVAKSTPSNPSALDGVFFQNKILKF